MSIGFIPGRYTVGDNESGDEFQDENFELLEEMGLLEKSFEVLK